MWFVTPRPGPPVVDFRVLKLNHSELWLGDTAAEDLHLNYCLSIGVNWIQLYGLYSVFGTGIEADLPAFIAKAKAPPYNMLKVGAIMGGGTTGFGLVLAYNAGKPSNEQFNDYNKENEFWRFPAAGTEDFPDWIASLQWLYPQLTGTGHTVSAYVQNYAVPVWGAPQAALMVEVIDFYEGTNYSGVPNELNLVDEQIQFIADAAAAISKVQNFLPLWSAEVGFMGPYLDANGILFAENAFDTDWYPHNFANQQYTRLSGYNYFSYTQMSGYPIGL